MSNPVVYLLIWFLLPIIPAYLFFKLLPAKAIVAGPFSGLKINLGGAFAGYFLLFAAAMPFIGRFIKPKTEVYEVWTAKGKVLDEKTGKPIPRSKNPRIVVFPPVDIINGEFSFTVIAERKGEKRINFPLLMVRADGYFDQNLESLDYKVGSKPQKQVCTMDCVDKLADFKPLALKDTSNIQNISYAVDDN